jgi:magnesium chelatase family protein
MSGGGKIPVPGEISLAHNGVLFLDELPHFKKSTLEVLRQPLEDAKITISRSLTSFTFPAKFMMVAAMNPCEDAFGVGNSDFYGCTESQKRKYYSKLSRALQDRIDLQIEVKRLKLEEITGKTKTESSSTIRERVVNAREIQLDRFKSIKRPIFANGQMKNIEIKKFCQIDAESMRVLEGAMERLNLSARTYFKILKIARTIADLEGLTEIGVQHIQEALQYRSLDFSKYY